MTAEEKKMLSEIFRRYYVVNPPPKVNFAQVCFDIGYLTGFVYKQEEEITRLNKITEILKK